MKKFLSLLVLSALMWFIPSPPIQQTALADQHKSSSKAQIAPASTMSAKTTHVEAAQTPLQTEAVQTTTPTPTPVVDTPTYPTDPIEIMDAAGIAASDQYYVRYIIEHEGGWCPSRWQGQRTCTGVYDPNYASLYNTNEGYGLCQSTPGIKMASAGEDYLTNPVTQMKWCNSHMLSDYGTWKSAYYHWINNGNW